YPYLLAPMNTAPQRNKARTERLAFALTRFLQAGIGFGLMALTLSKLTLEISSGLWEPEQSLWPWVQRLQQMPTLSLIGEGLIFSAALELAYMLITPDLDGAVDPLILGLAATILFRIEEARHAPRGLFPAAEIVVYIGALFSLFVIREVFIHRR